MLVLARRPSSSVVCVTMASVSSVASAISRMPSTSCLRCRENPPAALVDERFFDVDRDFERDVLTDGCAGDARRYSAGQAERSCGRSSERRR